ncbi:hypothetical protein [Cellulosimicrobium sp. SL-1]|uniref:hypothetical protein n=1 Tax=Cellulosimicrobium sp. SL-1 TaxID=2699423 RepID=UPI0013D20D72|nr:hypothetical protein [Cellulosimicrobium sp. SL-1]
MTRDQEGVWDRRIAEDYIDFLIAMGGAHSDRVKAESLSHSYNAFLDGVEFGDDPVGLTDHVLSSSRGLEVASAVGSGVLQELLERRPEFWDAIDEKAEASESWRVALENVWLDSKTLESMPSNLRVRLKRS